MKKTCRRTLLYVLVTVFLSASVPARAELDAGPFVLSDRSVDGNTRTKAFGPIYEKQVASDGKTFTALRPFYSKVGDPQKDRAVSHYLWPLGYRKEYRGQAFWWFLFSYGQDYDIHDNNLKQRTISFPYFGGRNEDGTRYHAVFPLGGSLYDYLGRDRMHFALWPLYTYSIVNDVETRDYLWPFFSYTTGEDIWRLKIFPLYSKSVTGERVNKFVLWPFWTSVKNLDPENPGSGFILFPLVGHGSRKDREVWMAIPPFFKWDERKEQRTVNAPYPFIQYAKGDINKFYIWPLWGKKRNADLRSSFILWPIFYQQKLRDDVRHLNRLQMLPFFYYRSKGENEVVNERYFKFWPLFSYAREGGIARTRFLELWPLRQSVNLDRNYASFWTLYSRHRNGNSRESELLWGIYRSKSDGAEEKSMSLFPLYSSRKSAENGGVRNWKFLLGLVGYKREGLKKQVSFLYLPIYRSGYKKGSE